VACDAGNPRDVPRFGPAIRVVASNGGPTAPLPADGVLRVAFDRPLLPSSITRQSLTLRDAAGTPVLAPVVRYDPVLKVVSLSGAEVRSARWLEPGLVYKLTIALPEDGGADTGLRAIDGAPFDEADPRRAIAFAAGPDAAEREPLVRFCDVVLPLFAHRCGGGGCHGTGGRPAAGLELVTPEGVARTALGRVARGANTGPRAGVPRAPGRVFGIDMPLVDPSSPANSWLIYKLLLGEEREADAGVSSRGACDGGGGPTILRAGVEHAPWTAADRAALGAYVPGHEMPTPSWTDGRLARERSLSEDELSHLRAWIEQGAKVDDCNVCP